VSSRTTSIDNDL